MKPPRRDDGEGSPRIDPDEETIEAPPAPARFLSHVGAFKQLDEELLTLIHSGMSARKFGAGQHLMRQGEPGASLIVLADGHAEVCVEEKGRHHTLKRVGPGDVVGEMALLTGEPRSASVTALDPVRAWELPADRFHRLAADNPKVSVLLTLLLCSRLGTAEHDALTGKVFYGHRISRRLGRGGMSVVYEAEEQETGRRVALKMMSHKLLYDRAALSRFSREARIIESLDHPNIAKTHGRFEAFRTYFIVVEFCDGVSIEDAIASHGPLPERLVRQVLGQLVPAIAHVHRHGLIHGDIKPSNVMITRDGTVKLIDFGIARGRDDSSVGPLLGTPLYMAPEQMSKALVVKETDLFALGQVAFTMLAGAAMFTGETLWSVTRELKDFHIPDLATRLPAISSELRAVLSGVLVAEPDDRSIEYDLVARWGEAVDFAAIA